MSLRAKIFIVFSIIVLAILGVSIFLVVYSKKKAQVVQVENPQTNVLQTSVNNVPGNITEIPENLPSKKLTSEEVEKNAVEQIAKVFLERYGTYSNQNGYQNIQDVKNLVTTAYWGRLSVQMTKPQAGDYIGMTTKVITTNLTDWAQNKAVVELKSVRVEDNGTQEISSYKNAVVDLVKSNGNWLVSGMVWR